MPIVSTPGQQPVSFSSPTPPTAAAPIVSDMPIYDNAPLSSATFTDPVMPQQPPVTYDPVVPAQSPPPSSRLQNLMSNPMQGVSPQPTSMFPPNDPADFGSDEDDPFYDDTEGFGTLPQPPMGPRINTPQKQLSLSRMTEEQRRKTILDTFMLVLGKEPLDRDYSYYRFSTLTEDGLVKSLLSLPEHKQMVDKAKEHTSLKQGMSDLDLRAKQLDTNLQSMQQELITLQGLLAEKNRYIQQMRGLPVDYQPVPFAMPTPAPSYAPPIAPVREPVQPIMQPAPVSAPTVATKSLADVQVKTLPGPFDEMKSMLGSLFRKKE